MRNMNSLVLLATLLALLGGGCARQQEQTVKYPKRIADNPERKSGPAMLFYEAAEEDADPHNVIVTPPPTAKDQATP